jgi:hypothetical protein
LPFAEEPAGTPSFRTTASVIDVAFELLSPLSFPAPVQRDGMTLRKTRLDVEAPNLKYFGPACDFSSFSRFP